MRARVVLLAVAVLLLVAGVLYFVLRANRSSSDEGDAMDAGTEPAYVASVREDECFGSMHDRDPRGEER